MSAELLSKCAAPDARAFVYPLLARLAAYPDDHNRRLILERAGIDLAEAGTAEAEDLLDLIVNLVAEERVPPARLLVLLLTVLEA